MQVLPATTVSASVCLQPLCGSLLAVLWLGEHLSVWDSGAILILGGLGLVLVDTAEEGATEGHTPRHTAHEAHLGLLRRGDGHDSNISLTSSFMSAASTSAAPQLGAL